MPQPDKSYQRATRIPQSRPLICLQSTSRTGRPYECLKAARSFAYNRQVAPAGHTNTLKPPAHLPTTDKSHRQAIRIPQSCPLNCLQPTSRTGRPYECLKAARSFAYNRQVAPAGHTNTSKPPAHLPTTGQVVPAGHTNTSKPPAHLPTTDKSNRQAIRIP